MITTSKTKTRLEVNKNNNIIVINGRHYDAKTGKAVSRQAQPVTATVARHEITSRKPARHVTAHAPKPARTLMRQAVKKPSDSLKRNITIQAHLGGSIAPGHTVAITRPQSRRQSPPHHETGASKGRLISHFSPDLFVVVKHTTAATHHAVPNSTTAHAAVHPAPAHRKPQTTAELLEYAVQQANGPEQPLPRSHRRKLLRRHTHASTA